MNAEDIPLPVLQLALFGQLTEAELTVESVREALACARERTKPIADAWNRQMQPTPEMMTLVLR